MDTKTRRSQCRIRGNPNPELVNEEDGLIVEEVEKMEIPPELPKDTPLCQFLEKIR